MVVNNPNNWHWVDKNCLQWSKEYFETKLPGLKGQNGDSSVEIVSVSSVEGDVDVSQRKGKVISLFDIRIILTFQGKTKEDSDVSGSITVPELAYDSELEDLQFEISIYNESSQNTSLNEVIKKQLLPKLRETLIKFGPDLISTNSKDIQLSQDKVTSTFTKANQTVEEKPKTKEEPKVSPNQTKPVHKPTGSSIPKYNTTTLHLEPSFNTTAEQLYLTLLDEARISAWTRSYPIIDQPAKDGSEFKFFGGSVQGKILKLVPNEEICQLWRLDDWKTGHYAELNIKLVQSSGETKMVVKFTGIPIGEEERVRDNFEERYIKSIKITFGFGAVL